MSETNQLPVSARALLAGAGIDLDRFDTEVQFAEIETRYEEEEAA